MTKTEEFQKVYEEIESEVNYVYSSDTISSFRLLVKEMLKEMSSLEETVYLLSSPKNAKKLHKSIKQAQSGKLKPQAVDEIFEELEDK